MAFLAVVAVAFGIGLTTAMFSIVNGTLLRGLPVPDSQDILHLSLHDVERQRGSSFFGPGFRAIASRQHAFEQLAAFVLLPTNVVGPGGAVERYSGARISTNTFGLLRVTPTRGRDFRSADGEPGAVPVVIIGHGVWLDLFGGVTDVIGSTLRVNGATMTVVGVMPPTFRFPLSHDLWLPLSLESDGAPTSAGAVQVIGRLKADISPVQAQAEMSALAKRLDVEEPDGFKGQTLRVKPYVEQFLVGGTAGMIYTMLAASLGVLLIACVNVANLMLARGADRTREMAVRSSVGASRWRVIRQLLAEVFVLTAVGAVIAVVLAQIGIALFNQAIAETQPPFWIDIRIDPVVLVFVTLITVATVVIAGVSPALRLSKFDLRTAMSEESRGTSAHIGRFSRALVIVEVALSCGLAVASALIIEGIVRASSTDFGFATSDIWHARLILPAQDYPDEGKQRRALDQLVAGLQAIPAAVTVAVATDIPIPLGSTATPRAIVKLAGHEYVNESDYAQVRSVTISPRFFDVLRVVPIEGRAFNDRDGADAPPVAIVNASFAHTYFPQGAIGQSFALARGPHREWRAIVGIVPDLGMGKLYKDAVHEAIYLPVNQVPPSAVRLLVHAAGPPLNVTASARDVARHVDPNLPIFNVGTLDQSVRLNTWPLRVFGAVFVAFGIAGLLLAAIGLYGVIAHAVSLRTQEIGVRMAMGAEKGKILRMVLRQGLAQILIGAALGVWLALALAASLEFLLFGVSPRDPRIFALTLSVLVATGVLACLVPARRAASVDPMEALRHQ